MVDLGVPNYGELGVMKFANLLQNCVISLKNNQWD